MNRITHTVLEVIKERVFPHTARTVYEWNHNPENVRTLAFGLVGLQTPVISCHSSCILLFQAFKISPIFSPVIAPRAPGFTAVILAYDRIPSLFQVIERVALVPSLSKVLIIWNNQNKKPPSGKSKCLSVSVLILVTYNTEHNA